VLEKDDMSREIHSLRACLGALQKLMQLGANGTFYLVDADNEIAAITLHDGVIEEVGYHGHRGDAAVNLIKALPSASTLFHAGSTRAARHSQLSAHALNWLGGMDTVAPESSTASAGRSSPPPVPAGRKAVSAGQRKAVEAIAFTYLGPVAPTVCAAAFADFDELDPVVDEIAAMLPPEEAKNFRSEITKAIGNPG
jgi:hypothetical protein